MDPILDFAAPGPARRCIRPSLRLQLIGLILISLIVSLALGGIVACIDASRSVAREMDTALAVGAQTIAAEIATLPNAALADRDIARLMLSFRGNRHLDVALVGSDGFAIAPVADRPALADVPDWFVRLIHVPSVSRRIPLMLDARFEGYIRIETRPRNEIGEVWDEFCDGALVLALFAVPLIAGVYVMTGRLLRPLASLAAGMRRIGGGDYAIRLDARLPAEFGPLIENFNRMARRLAETQAENHRLNERMLTVQDMERSDIARDLHDEIGPLLFAIRIDASKIAQDAGRGASAAIQGHAHAVADAVALAQRHLRDLLGRLRAFEAPVASLPEAIGDLVAFWRLRHPEIAYRVAVAADWDGLDGIVEKIVCRIVQESLCNAIRHGHPRMIAIDVGRDGVTAGDGNEVLVRVADDGGGTADQITPGFGLIGMHERVAAVNGVLSVVGRPGGGVVVTARLPVRRDRAVPCAMGACA